MPPEQSPEQRPADLQEKEAAPEVPTQASEDEIDPDALFAGCGGLF